MCVCSSLRDFFYIRSVDHKIRKLNGVTSYCQERPLNGTPLVCDVKKG